MTTKSQKLEDQAATAALYVTKGKNNKSVTKPSGNVQYPLDEHNKLSSAGAATSLKHADPRDLPAFPVVGLANPASSAGGAATLANKNKKSFEYWKPGEIPEANKAAMLAKDYKMAPLWHEELSAGASKAALLAAKDGGDVKIWRPSPTDAGNSAAGQAMKMKGLSPQLDYGHTEEGGKRAMMAATQSMASGRKRAGSTPIEPPGLYPDSKNSAANALKAATSVAKRGQPAPVATSSTGVPINAGKIHSAAITNLSREMYTSHPPVAPEIEEQNRQATLRASAVAMAQQMYNVQQRALEEAAVDQERADSRYGATHAHNRPTSAVPEASAPPQYANLQQAAQKLAAERLAKLHDEHAAYRSYYGTQASPQSHKLSIRGRGRRRASSDGQGTDEDEERSRQIRNQMSLFTDKLAQVDNKKRKSDRDSLMAAAQRNVRASMTAQDEKVFNETGKVSPAMMADWEAKARAKAEAESSTRLANHGKVNIGGGRYMDQSEIDAIAAAKVQPTLDEVTATAEKRRATDEELRQRQLERDRLAAGKQQDQKTRDQQTKDAWKRFKEEEKRDARAKKDEERARKLEDKRLRDAEKQRLISEKTVSKAPVTVEAPQPELVAEPVIATVEAPPVTEPVPDTAEKVQEAAVEEPKSQVLPGDEERIEPTFLPMSQKDEITASQANLVPTDTEEPELERMVTAESEISVHGQGISGDAEVIAQRVFSAPVENEIPLDPALESKTEETIKATANVGDAPVVQADIVTVSDVQGQVAPSSTSATAAAPLEEKTPASTTAEPTTVKKYDAPVTARIAPPISAAMPPTSTTETTVSGPSASGKTKESKGVSSWLKTKFSRRASKSINQDSAGSATDSKDKGFVGGATLTNTEANRLSSDHGDSSMREVAMAGKETTAPTTTTTIPSGLVSPNDGDVESASPRAAGGPQRHSTSSVSVSSLSSDEDNRGRSAIPREREPLNQDEFLKQEMNSGEHVDPALVAGQQLDPSLMAGHAKGESSTSGGGEDFEEARDEFDSEKLNPPDKSIVGGKDRPSASPARDSKFLEDL